MDPFEGVPQYLSPEHLRMLEVDSGITPGVIEQRGYRSVKKEDALRVGFKPFQAADGLLIPIYNAVGIVQNYQLRPDKPRLSEEGKPIKYETRASSMMVVDVPPACRDRIGDPSQPLWFTEGIKKVDCAVVRGLTIAGLLGVWLFRGKNAKGGKSALPDFQHFSLAGRLTYIAFDSDCATNPAVTMAMCAFADVLESYGADVRYVILPSEDGRTVKLDDWFTAGRSSSELIKFAQCNPPVKMPRKASSNLPQIITNNREGREILVDSLRALVGANKPERIFLRGGGLSRIESDEKSGFVIRTMSAPAIRWELLQSADWINMGKDDAKHVWPPKDISEMIVAAGVLPEGFNPLHGLSGAPVLSKDGTVRRQSGYDPSSGWFITGDGPWPDWDGDGASAAQFLLDELFVDFPFDGAASRANAVGLFVLPFVRSVIDGPIPLQFIDAPMPGTGKGLLAEMALYPTMGKLATTTVPDDEDALKKLIFSLVCDGAPYVFFDNFKGRLNSSAMESVLTSRVMRDRVLGMTGTAEFDVNQIFLLTANNGKLSADGARRSVWIRLDAQREDPSTRGGFKHADIRQWVKENRYLLASAGIAMVEAWVAAGRPRGTKKKGSYETWSAIVGGILDVCGIAGFLDNDKDLKMTASEDDELWRPFYEAWFARFRYEPVETGLLCKMALEHDFLGHIFDRAKTERGRSTAFGRALSSREGVVVGPLVVRKFTMSAGAPRYKLTTPGELVNSVSVAAREKTSNLFSSESENAYIEVPGDSVHQFTKQVQIDGELSISTQINEEDLF